MIIALSMTLLPDPVEPAISRCGIVSSDATLMRPLISLPSAIVRRDGDSWNSFDSRISRRLMTSRLVFGTSMPTVGLPGMPFDQDRFGLQAEAEILGQRRNAAVLDARFRLEFEGRDHGAGVDLNDRCRAR